MMQKTYYILGTISLVNYLKIEFSRHVHQFNNKSLTSLTPLMKDIINLKNEIDSGDRTW